MRRWVRGAGQRRAVAWIAVWLGLGLCLACGDDAGPHPSGADASDSPPDRDGGADSGGDPGSPDAAVHADSGMHGDAGPMPDADLLDGELPVDDVPPQLVESTPGDGDDNVAFDAPLRLLFSEPVELGADAITLRQEAPERSLPFEATLVDDGHGIEVTFAAPEEIPARLTLELGAGITDRAGNPIEPTQLHFGLPTWQRLGAAVDRDPSASTTDLQLALDPEGRPVLLTVEGGDVYASRWQDGAFQALGAVLNQSATLASPGAESRVALLVNASGEPIAAFRESSSVRVVRWDGAAWQDLGDAVDAGGGGSYAPALGLDAAGEPVVAFDALGASSQPVLRVRVLAGSAWQTLEEIDAQARGVRLASGAGSEIRLAYQESGGDIVTLRWDGAGLVPLGSGATLPAISGSFALSTSDAATSALTAQGQGTLLCQSASCSALAQDLGFESGSAAGDRVLAHAPDGALLAAFSETAPGEAVSRVYVQRLEAGRFQPLGPVLNRSRNAHATQPALAVDAAGQPIVAHIETANGGAEQVFVARYNGDPARPPYGVHARGYDPGCLASVPLDGSPLTQTGCFADAGGREPVAGFIPFDVRSPLWSDGAFKRRFVMLPEGTRIDYRDPGIWTLPAGAILIKEFSIEARRGDPSTLRPVETRFLVVRDSGNWDRYSYEWNQAATEALLRPASPALDRVSFAIEAGDGTPDTQVHFYPSRSLCLQCHETPGTVLGLQTAMMNRNFDYGDTVDNQLRTLQQLGLFGDAFSDDALPQARVMANPADTTESLEARIRAYLHANCSSCHRPLFGMDLRIQNTTLDSGLCTKISKGDLDGSVIYWRDVLRQEPGNPGVPAPMPPLGTLVANPQLEMLLTEFILDPQNPCP